jgi:hypothetical protein
MANKKIYNGLLVMVLLAVITSGLVSCAALNSLNTSTKQAVAEKETETSKALLSGANEILVARENGMLRDQFKAALILKFPGLAFDDTVSFASLTNPGVVTFVYEERQYRLGMRHLGSGESLRYTAALVCIDATEE